MNATQTKTIVLALIIVAAAGILLYYPSKAADNTQTGPATSTGKAVQKPIEEIKVSGAWALYPLMVKWAEEYQKANPNTMIEVSAGGAGKGMADALSNLVEIGMVSRDVDPAEVEKGAFPIAVAIDAVIPTMNKNNPLAQEIRRKGVKKGQFIDAFIKKKDMTWGDIAGNPDVSTKILVYVRSDACGAAEIWAKYLNAKQEDLVGIGVNADPGIAEAVSRDVNGMGFNNLNFAYDPETQNPLGDLMMIPIDINEDGTISTDEEFYSKKTDMVAAIADGKYPFPPSRNLYIVTKGKPNGATKEFIQWILTDGQQYVLPNGYIPLKENVLKEQTGKIM